MQKSVAANLCTAALCLIGFAAARAQDSHPAVCRESPFSPIPPVNGPLLGKVVASLGDPRVLASLRGIRYTAELSPENDPTKKIQMTLTRAYPDHVVVVTHIAGLAETRLEVSPVVAFKQVSGGEKTDLAAEMKDELLKVARLDRYYVGQNIGSGKITVTETGTEMIDGVEATALRVTVEGAEAMWFVDGANGRLLRTIIKVPSNGERVDQQVDYSDWRNCDGLMVPFRETITKSGKVGVGRTLTVELNPNLPNGHSN
jgi:hypothetical protein